MMIKKSVRLTRSEIVTIILTLIMVTAVSWFNLEKSRRLQRDLSRKTDLDRIIKAMGYYYQVYNSYPASSDNYKISACGSEGKSECIANQKWEDGEVIYLDYLPVDPKTFIDSRWPDYGYRAEATGSSFWLWAYLENGEDSDIISAQEKCPGNWQKNQYVVCKTATQ
ncbi:MAG TPA: hypothetical protein VMW41_03650 [Candidatus Bathyarchaeia archaeon]|nr:hypothetical protein [Candidatus Bathyarchaeia archaeon]